MIKAGNFWSQGAYIAICLLLLVSCSNADVVGGVAGLRQQIANPDPKIIAILVDSPTARSELATIHPGAPFYLANSLFEHGLFREAALLFRTQLETEAAAWQGPAFQGWISSLRATNDWTAIIQQTPTVLDKLLHELAQPENDQVAASAEIGSSREIWQQAMIEAFVQLKQSHQAAAMVNQAEQGHSGGQNPSWLILAAAKVALLRLTEPSANWAEAINDDLLPALLSVDAQAGHLELNSLLQAAMAAQPPKPGPILEIVVSLLKAKSALASGQAQLSFDLLRDFLLPRGKAKAGEITRVKRLQATLLAIFDRYPGLPDAFFRDFYNAGRQAGQFSEGVKVIGEIQSQLVAPDRRLKQSAIAALVQEFKGRLYRAKGDHVSARTSFGQALRIASALEVSGQFDSADRQRILWYLLRSWTDDASDSGAALDVAGFIRSARLTDDPAYFDDVLEKAVLLLGGRQRWHDLEMLYRQMSPYMLPELQSRCALILARVSQLRVPSNAGERARFERFSSEARDGSDSIYYRSLAAWLRGEKLDIQNVLAAQTKREAFAGMESERTISPNWTVQVTAGFCSMARYDQGLDYLWDRRRAVTVPQLIGLGQTYLQAGRYRQGLRILESVRVRFGHPVDRTGLESFYPRPFLEALHASVNNSTVPEWLMFGLVRTESNFDTGADSSVGARGLAQLMPATAKLVAQRLGIASPDLADPAQNLRLGASYLRDQYDGFGSWPQALAAYNAGMGRVRSWVKTGLNPDPVLFAELIPVDESRNYVRRIVESSLIYNYLYYNLEPDVVLTLLFKAN